MYSIRSKYVLMLVLRCKKLIILHSRVIIGHPLLSPASRCQVVLERLERPTGPATLATDDDHSDDCKDTQDHQDNNPPIKLGSPTDVPPLCEVASRVRPNDLVRG